MAKRTLFVFFTGGTISMEHREGDIGVVPSDNYDGLLQGMSLVPDVILKPVWLSNIPSPHMDLDHMQQLCEKVDTALAKPDVAGAVILHGTDLLVETAFVIEQLLRVPKPVVLTGAMRHVGEQGYDGVRNLQNSIQASLNLPRSCEIMIQMADKLYTAMDAEKIDSLSVEPFTGKNLGSAGRITNEGVRLTNMTKVKRPRLVLDRPGASFFVPLITCYPGMDCTLINAAVDKGASGIVIEGFGAGNVTPSVEEAVVRAIEEYDIPVVLTTRCLKGGVSPCYGYPGGAASLKRKGTILAGSLSGTKAHLLLTMALQGGLSGEELAMLYKSI